jgi:chemotaxis signal transduction protein
MSQGPDKQSVLRERAQKLKARRVDAPQRELFERIVTIEVGRERFGLPLSRLREITRATPISPLPNLPACMLGICALRGELLSVLDLAELRGSGRTGSSPFFALVESRERMVALTFNALLEMRDVFRDDLVGGVPAAELARAFARAITHDGVNLLDVDRLLASELVLVGRHERRSGTAEEQTP